MTAISKVTKTRPIIASSLAVGLDFAAKSYRKKGLSMGSIKKLVRRTILAAWVFGLILLAAAGPSRAQAPPPSQNASLTEPNEPDSGATPDTVTMGQPPAADPAASGPAQVDTTAQDDGWHFSVSPYLWLPWIHGTLGVNGNDASFHATPDELISHFRFGLLGLVDTRYKRVVMPVDILWLRLGDDRALPNVGITANVKGTVFILSPKVGYRVIDTKMIKIDALAGLRYWYFGESLSFNPTPPNLKFSGSQDWVDPLVGGRILGNLSPKISIAIAGDVGGWGVGSQLDYQFGGFLGYRIKPAMALQAGYRYLAVNYSNGGGSRTADMIISGPLIGLTMTFK
jgi:hypothetical protein